MSKTICIFNQKGGVSKTTTAINLSAQLSELGKKVLLIDMDSQGNATTGLGINKKNTAFTTFDALTSEKNLNTIRLKIDGLKNLYLIPSTLKLIEAEFVLQSFEEDIRLNILNDKIEEVKAHYDYIILDCPPSLGFLSYSALIASDSFLAPIQPEYFAMEGVSQLLNTIDLIAEREELEIECEGFLITMYDKRLNLNKEVIEELKKHLEKDVLNTLIPRSVSLAEATVNGEPICIYDPNGRGGEAYLSLALEIMKRNGDGLNE